MKKLIILSAIAMSGLIANKANAQFSIHLGFHIPGPRVYVPAPPPVVVQEQPVYNDDYAQVNYNDDSDDYYYLPEVEAYYSISNHNYYYNDGSNWVTCAYLPGAYRNYDWRTAVRYEVRGNRPYMHNDMYRQRWGGFDRNRGDYGHRFERRYDGGYAYQNHGNRNDNRGWNGAGRDNNRDRGNWGGRPNDGGNRGNWGGQPNQGNGHNQGNWGGQPNRGDHNQGGWGGNQNHGNQGGQPNGGDHNQGGWGGNQNHGNQGGQPNNGGQQPGNQNHGGGQDHGSQGGGQSGNHNDGGNRGGRREFAANRGGFGGRR